MKLTFYGAARNVTGSCYFLEAAGRRILIDCGLYQERELRARNWAVFPFPAESIDAVLLTHAHLDHCGLLPKLVAAGYRGKIHGTRATLDIAAIVLADSARIQEEDAAFKVRRHAREGRKGPHPVKPLYGIEDAELAISRFVPADYESPQSLGPDLEVSFHDAGHILGSSALELRVGQGGAQRTVMFSGDVGRWNTPILRDPVIPRQADYVVVESTYGDRVHKARDSIPAELADVINSTRAAGGNVVIPSFSIERAQELLYYMHTLLDADQIPHLLVFLDSPMAVRVTEVFKRHPYLFDAESRELLARGEHPCDLPGLTMCRTVGESKAINNVRGTAVIVAGSGMCTGGRIKHHLAHNVGGAENTILFVGYQANGTLGRILLDGARDVRILGGHREVRARVRRIDGFSAHADRDELMRWLGGFGSAPRCVFVTHGEEDTANAFADHIRRAKDWQVTVPSYRDSVELD